MWLNKTKTKIESEKAIVFYRLHSLIQRNLKPRLEWWQSADGGLGRQGQTKTKARVCSNTSERKTLEEKLREKITESWATNGQKVVWRGPMIMSFIQLCGENRSIRSSGAIKKNQIFLWKSDIPFLWLILIYWKLVAPKFKPQPVLLSHFLIVLTLPSLSTLQTPSKTSLNRSN